MYHERSRSADRGTKSSKFDHIRRACLGVSAYLIGIVASTALVGALSAPTAQAASDYDNIVQIVRPLVLSRPGVEVSYDYSLDWFTEALEASRLSCTMYSTDCQTHTNLSNLLDSGGDWLVYRNTSGYQFHIVYTLTPGGYLNFPNTSELWAYPANSQTVYRTGPFVYDPGPYPNRTQSGLYYNGGSDSSGTGFGVNNIYLSTFNITYPPGYDGELIPDEGDDENPLYQEPWNLPAAETADCDWWNLTCFMGTVDFNPIRDVTQQASENLGFIAQFGEVIGELTEMMTAMPDFFGNVDPCWTTGQSSYCNIPVNIFDQESSISLHYIRNSPVMQAIMPWLLYAMMGLMAWNLFKSLPKLIEDITRA